MVISQLVLIVSFKHVSSAKMSQSDTLFVIFQSNRVSIKQILKEMKIQNRNVGAMRRILNNDIYTFDLKNNQHY